MTGEYQNKAKQNGFRAFSSARPPIYFTRHFGPVDRVLRKGLRGEAMSESQSASEPPGSGATARRVSVAAQPAVQCRVDVEDAERRLLPIQVERIRSALRAAAAELAVTGEVRVRIVGDAAMSAAHERYSRISGTTDVLTFDLRDDAGRRQNAAEMDVDLLLCVDEAARQAADRGHEVEHELVLYAVHGILHCLGHDDHDEAAYQVMHALEDRVLEAIGIGAIFSRGIAQAGFARTDGVTR